MSRRLATAPGRYAVAILWVVAGLLVTRASVGPLGGALFMFQFAAVVASALLGGLGPGLVTAALSGTGHALMFAPGLPRSDVYRLAAFAAASILFAWLASRLRNATQQEQRARREAERAEAAARAGAALQERLLAVVSHDLRSPLAAITLSAGLLEHRAGLDERDARALSRIQASAARMQALVADLLDFARAQHGGGLPVRRVDARLGDICERVLDELRAAHPERVFRLTVTGDDRAPLDPDRVEQVVANLLANAVKHGAVASPIDAAVDGARDGTVRLAVTNQGPAIAPALIPTLFDAFRAGEGSGSVGLGLYIVREIARAHGGSATVASGEDGTTFTVVFPGREGAALAPA